MSKIAILGAGESGVGAATLAKKQGYEVLVSDGGVIKPHYRLMLEQRGIEYEEQGHSLDAILSADEVVKSPGIPDKAPVIQSVISKGIPIISEIEFAGRYSGASKMFCITGSNGKTTTTSLTYHILKEAGMDVGLAGNIGDSLALQVAESPHSYYVIELSSFQLDNMYHFKADVAILLNITPDHLDRYQYEFQNYIDAKFRIIRNQTSRDAFIYWKDDPVIARELTKRRPMATLYPFSDACHSELKGSLCDGQMIIHTPNGIFSIDRNELSLKGRHNLYNAMAASLAAKMVGVSDVTIRESLGNFKGVEHRMEFVARVKGVDYINDSKATNVNSCWYALQSVHVPVVLILGGTDKGNDYSEIEPLVSEKVKALVFMGVDNTKLHHFFDGKIKITEDARSMQEAIEKATRLATEGDTVLLSPCCASFDLFNNYEDRGKQFKECVLNLQKYEK